MARPLAAPPYSLLSCRNWAINSHVHALLGFPLLAFTVLNCPCPPSSSHLSWRRQEPVHPFHFPVTNLSHCPPPCPTPLAASCACCPIQLSSETPEEAQRLHGGWTPSGLPLCLPWTASFPSLPTSHSSPLSSHTASCMSLRHWLQDGPWLPTACRERPLIFSLLPSPSCLAQPHSSNCLPTTCTPFPRLTVLSAPHSPMAQGLKCHQLQDRKPR